MWHLDGCEVPLDSHEFVELSLRLGRFHCTNVDGAKSSTCSLRLVKFEQGAYWVGSSGIGSSCRTMIGGEGGPMIPQPSMQSWQVLKVLGWEFPNQRIEIMEKGHLLLGGVRVGG